MTGNGEIQAKGKFKKLIIKTINMKNLFYLFSLLTGILLIILFQVATAQAATSIYVNPLQTNVNLGDSFVVTVDVNTDDNAYAVSLELYFDKSKLNATNVTEGDFLKKDGANTFVAVNNIDNTAGKITYAVTRFGTQNGVTGTGSLLTISFDAVGFGTGDLNLDNVDLSDNNLQSITVSVTNGSVKVNRLPSASNLRINPTSPKTTDNLVGSYTYSDPDNDTETGTEIRWYKNGVHQAAYDNLLNIPSNATAKGEEWYFTVKPGDGTGFGNMKTSPSVIIQNSPPVQPHVNVTPDFPVTTDDLICMVSGSTDADGDLVTYSYKWYKNNILQPGQTTNTVSSALTSRGEVWKCIVTPNDGKEDGPAGEDQVIIQNLAPKIDSFAPPSTTLETREGFFLRFNHTSSDPDGDALTYSWKLDGIEQATTQSWMYSPTTLDCGSRIVLLTVSDGILANTKSWTVNVGLRGDVDGNRKVDIFDLAAVGLAFGSQPGDKNWNGDADINPGPQGDGTPEGNGEIDIFDLATAGLNYRRTC